MADEQTTRGAMIPLAAFRAMMEAVLTYVPHGQVEAAWGAALAIGMGYAYPPIRTSPEKNNGQ